MIAFLISFFAATAGMVVMAATAALAVITAAPNDGSTENKARVATAVIRAV